MAHLYLVIYITFIKKYNPSFFFIHIPTMSFLELKKEMCMMPVYSYTHVLKEAYLCVFF